MTQLRNILQGLCALLQLGQQRLRGVEPVSHVLLGQPLMHAVPADDLPYVRTIRRCQRRMRYLQPAHDAPVAVAHVSEEGLVH